MPWQRDSRRCGHSAAAPDGRRLRHPNRFGSPMTGRYGSATVRTVPPSTDSRGRVLDTPSPLPGVKSPQNPFLGSGTLNLPPKQKVRRDNLVSCSGRILYPMLEGPLATDADQHRLIISEFNVRPRHYTGQQWFYRLEAASSTGPVHRRPHPCRRSRSL